MALENLSILKIGNNVNNWLHGRKIGNVANKNANVRTFMLMRNIGKYGMFDEPMYPEIGMVYNPYERILVRPTDMGVINGIIGYNNGIVNQGLMQAQDSGFYESSSYADADGIEGLLNNSEYLSKNKFALKVEEALDKNRTDGGAEQYRKLIYSSNGGKRGGGEGTLRETMRTIEEYLNRVPYINHDYTPDWSIDLNGRRNEWSDDRLLTETSDGHRTYRVYAEKTKDGKEPDLSGVNDSYSSSVEVFEEDTAEVNRWNSVLKRTNRLFNDGRINSLINRFHTSGDNYKTAEETMTAFDPVYGMSRGRNLLKKKPTQNSDPHGTGYDNPYCRVWTSHHQYSTLKDRIRPFVSDDGNGGEEFISVEGTQKIYSEKMRPNGGGKRLADFSVLKSNGFVNITPYYDKNGVVEDSIKRCMFSIENLAWKDIVPDKSGKNGPSLTKEQRGPNGGRIMWFPPYNLSFSENVNARWNGNTFIGRGEDIYTYTNTERGGTLNFSILIDHPSVVSEWATLESGSKDEEDDLLRFFAGCQLQMDIKEPQEEQTEPEEKKTKSVEPVQTGSTTEYRFAIFFPNNFSGDDFVVNGNIDDAIYYLIGGYSGGTFVADCGYEIGAADSSGFGALSGSTLYSAFQQPATADNTTWKYIVDNEYVNQNLGSGNYEDTYAIPINRRTGASWGKVRALMDGSFDTAHLYSFYELAAALYGDTQSGSTVTPGAKFPDSLRNARLPYVDENVMAEELMRVLAAQQKKPTITCEGWATTQGEASTSQTRLARKRANFIKKWLLQKFEYGQGQKLSEEDIRIDVKTKEMEEAPNSINTDEAKLNRRVYVRVFFEDNVDVFSNTENNGTDVASDTHVVYDQNGNFYNVYNEYDEHGVPISRLESTIVIADRPHDGGTNSDNDNRTVDKTQEDPRQIYSYDEEYRYFKDLEKNNPMVFKRILDKVKVFQPAFHSITPEGFNARLTFLQQCTRQGPTPSGSANNLAFGRPPYCILRIGDFYNTKILIESVTIDYDETTWDMNPEGIGVQPMIAKVSLSFKFVGGTDITGPIEKLQNAVSFNYYSNTSVYDRRADYRNKFDGPVIEGDTII